MTPPMTTDPAALRGVKDAAVRAFNDTTDADTRALTALHLITLLTNQVIQLVERLGQAGLGGQGSGVSSATCCGSSRAQPAIDSAGESSDASRAPAPPAPNAATGPERVEQWALVFRDGSASRGCDTETEAVARAQHYAGARVVRLVEVRDREVIREGDGIDWRAAFRDMEKLLEAQAARVRELEGELALSQKRVSVLESLHTGAEEALELATKELAALTAERSEDGTLGARFNSLLDACYRFIGEEPDMYGAAPPEARVTAALERLTAERERGAAAEVKEVDPGVLWRAVYVPALKLPTGTKVLVIPLETKP